MAVSQSFVDFVLGQLESIGPMTAKRMFGGVGLYAGDLFFAIVAGDVLYIKADGTTREVMQRAGARPFQPYPNRPGGKGAMQYTACRSMFSRTATRCFSGRRGRSRSQAHNARPKPCATSDLPR